MAESDKEQPAPQRHPAVERACVDFAVELKSLLAGMLRSKDLAEEAYQRTVVKAMQASFQVREETLRGWLFRIAVNEARLLRREAKRDTDRIQKAVEQGSFEWLKDLLGSCGSAEQSAMREEVIEKVRKCLAQLPPKQQLVIHQRIFIGKAFSEIAGDIDVPLGTVLTWMRRGLEQLRNDAELQDLW
ncbi:MAG: sigma-70 family RNA polymerase sigma factor [Planctomycetaceae bacterium]